jgi:predicted PurR-regulated permease PerM
MDDRIAPPDVPALREARSRRPSALALGVGLLATIAVVAALYLARAFFVPLLIGILASYALDPVVSWLHGWRIPRALGAALVVGGLVGAVAWTGFALGDDAAAIVEKLPDAARKVRQRVTEARAVGPSALQKIQEAATELQGAASEASEAAKPARRAPVAAIRPAEPSVWLRDYMLAQSALLLAVAAQLPIVLLLAYFLLASGEHFRRKLVQLVGPSLARKKDAVRILEEIDVQVQRYLLAMLGSNVLVGIGTWLAFSGIGMEQAGVWGVAAGVLHFIPYLGPVVFAAASGAAAFMQFGTAVDAFIVAGVSLVVATTIGSLLMTWLQSRFARVNAAVLFIALLFFGWLWGVWGLLLGAPLLAITKVICDRVESLRPAGELLGH